MSDTTPQQEAVEKAWRLLTIQADTMLKLAQTQAEPWKVAIAGMAASARWWREPPHSSSYSRFSRTPEPGAEECEARRAGKRSAIPTFSALFAI